MATFGLKPQVPQINWNNPLTKGLVFDAPMYERGGTLTRDLASGTYGTLANGPTWVSNANGSAINFDNVDDIINFTAVASQTTLTLITVESLIYPTGWGEATAGGRLLTKGAAPRIFWGLSSLVGAGREINCHTFGIGGTGGDGQWYTPTDSLALNKWWHISATYDFSSLSNVPIMYINGAAQTLTQLALPQTAYDADTTVLDIGNRAAGDRTFAGYVSYVRIWNRILLAAEIRQLYDSPWKMYRKPIKRSLNTGV